jgi:polyribonucleotide nucleotidyltransferase
VDYREYTYASGRIPGGFFKREANRPEKEVLTSRLIDRPIRPLFPTAGSTKRRSWRSCISADTENDSDVLAITGASAALSLSSVPFEKRSPACASAWSTASTVINPTYAERKQSKMDLVGRGQRGRDHDGGGRREAGDRRRDDRRARSRARRIKQLVAGIDDLNARLARPRRPVTAKAIGHEFYREVEEKAYVPLAEAMRIQDKLENYASVDKVLADLVASIPEGEVERRTDAKNIFKGLKERSCATRFSSAASGSTAAVSIRSRRSGSKPACCPACTARPCSPRGETQALVSATLGTEDDAQKIETVEGETYRRFMLHYNFPPFSVGEVQFLRGPGPPRSGPRRARRARDRAAAAERRGIPLHRPHRLRHPRIERVVLDGVGLRRRAGADGLRASR